MLPNSFYKIVGDTNIYNISFKVAQDIDIIPFSHEADYISKIATSRNGTRNDGQEDKEVCGIFGYIGRRRDAPKIVLEGLKRLEYRGYDSWGIAVPTPAKVAVFKKVGAIGLVDDVDLPDSTIAIGHTRWATHGGVTQVNAHPHYSSDKSFVLAQNGICENFEELRRNLLKKGYKFESETDTEVIVRLIEEKLKSNVGIERATRAAFNLLRGRNTIIILTNEGEVIGARNGSPLVVGRAKNGDIFISSDTHSFSNAASEVIVLDNGQMVVGKGKDISLYDLKSGKKLRFKFTKTKLISEDVDREGFDHFMTKEIFESLEVIRSLITQRRKPLLDFAKKIKGAKRVFTIGSGTAGVAAAQIAYFLRSISKINAVSLVGADAVEYYDLFKPDDLLIAPSQSGETADVLEVLEIARKKGVKIASYVNMPGSMMTKISDFPFSAGAGPEICVMSTKVFTSMIAWGYLLAKCTAGKYAEGVRNLSRTATEIDKYLKEPKNQKSLKLVADILAKKPHIFLLGKAQNFQIIREGMVKIIEASYKHAHAIPAGDLKHYAITLIESGVPVLVIVSNDEVKHDVISAISQVKARGASVIAIAPFEHQDFDLHIKVPDLGETSSIMNVIPLQLLAYYMAVKLGNNVDQPRNIAKSVTVK